MIEQLRVFNISLDNFFTIDLINKSYNPRKTCTTGYIKIFIVYQSIYLKLYKPDYFMFLTKW